MRKKSSAPAFPSIQSQADWKVLGLGMSSSFGHS